MNLRYRKLHLEPHLKSTTFSARKQSFLRRHFYSHQHIYIAISFRHNKALSLFEVSGSAPPCQWWMKMSHRHFSWSVCLFIYFWENTCDFIYWDNLLNLKTLSGIFVNWNKMRTARSRTIWECSNADAYTYTSTISNGLSTEYSNLKSYHLSCLQPTKEFVPSNSTVFCCKKREIH